MVVWVTHVCVAGVRAESRCLVLARFDECASCPAMPLNVVGGACHTGSCGVTATGMTVWRAAAARNSDKCGSGDRQTCRLFAARSQLTRSQSVLSAIPHPPRHDLHAALAQAAHVTHRPRCWRRLRPRNAHAPCAAGTCHRCV